MFKRAQLRHSWSCLMLKTKDFFLHKHFNFSLLCFSRLQGNNLDSSTQYVHRAARRKKSVRSEKLLIRLEVRLRDESRVFYCLRRVGVGAMPLIFKSYFHPNVMMMMAMSKDVRHILGFHHSDFKGISLPLTE